MLNLDRVRIGTAGTAIGLLIAVFYLRRSAVAPELLDNLRDGALLLALLSAGLSLWQVTEAKARRSA